MKKRKPPWFIWLSFFGLAWLQDKHDAENTAGMTTWSDRHSNRHMGYLGRFAGLFFGVFGIPVVWMLHVMNRLPEPWATVWNCLILAYAYFAGVFITWRLYRYLERG